MNERRRALRKRTVIGARVFIGKTGTLDGTVRSISASGARIVFPLPTATPDEFEVEIAGHGRFRVRAMWRNGTAVGVALIRGARVA